MRTSQASYAEWEMVEEEESEALETTNAMDHCDRGIQLFLQSQDVF